MGLGSFALGAAGVGDAASNDAKAQARLLEAARKAASTENFQDINKDLLGSFRELQATGAIPGFQSAAATANARSGLTGTGLGNALSTAAGGAGELQALQQAIQQALAIQQGQIGANVGFAGIPLGGPSRSNLFGQATENVAKNILQAFGMSGGATNTGQGGPNPGAFDQGPSNQFKPGPQSNLPGGFDPQQFFGGPGGR